MKQLSKIIAFGLVCLGSAGTVSAGSSAECVTRNREDVFLPADAGFAVLVAEVNAIVDAQPVRPGFHSERARIEDGAEYVRVEMNSTTCESTHDAAPTASATCLTPGCESAFPGTNAPLGAALVLESCANGDKTTATYERVSSAGSLTWRLTELHQSEVGTCPRLKQPGMGG